MEYRFFIIVEGSNPKFYKVPRIQTARLIGEYPNQKFQIYKTLRDAKRAALAIVNRVPANAKTKASITQFPGQPAPEMEDSRMITLRLTEDRVENFHFWH